MAVVNVLSGTITSYTRTERSDGGVTGWSGTSAGAFAMDWDLAALSAGAGFNTNTTIMQCAWQLTRETGMGSSGLNFTTPWPGTCPVASSNVPDGYNTDGFQPLGWIYDYSLGGLFSDTQGYRAYVADFGENYSTGYGSQMQRPYGSPSTASVIYEVWVPEYNEALSYNWSRTDDDQIAEFVDRTFVVEAQSGNWTGQTGGWPWFTDQTVELWRVTPPTTEWMGTTRSRGHDPSSFQGQYLATFPPAGGTTYTITRTGAELGMSGWPNTNTSVFYGSRYERYMLIPTALWNPSRPSHGFAPTGENYNEYHMGPSFNIRSTTRYRSCPYKRYYIEEFPDNAGSAEWSAVLTDSINDTGSYVKVCSPERVEFESGPYPNAELLYQYDLTNGYSILSDFNSTWRKVQISKTEGVTVLATNTDPYFAIRSLRSARSHPAGIHTLDKWGYANLYDHTTLAGLGEWVVPGAVSAYTTGHGFFGDVIQVDGDMDFYVSKTAPDGLGFDETVYVPTPVDHNNNDFDVAVYTFDEWGVGYLCVNSSGYWEDPSEDLYYTYVYSFDINYNFRPGYIKVPAAYAWSAISAWPIRGSTGMVLFRLDDPTGETYLYNGNLLNSNESDLGSISVAGLSTTANVLTSEWRTLCEFASSYPAYPGWSAEFPYHTGGGGGFATTWGAKSGVGTGNLNRLSVSGVSETVGSGNTVLETEVTTSNNLVYNGGVVSLGPVSAPNLDGEFTEQRRKFWRPRPGW